MGKSGKERRAIMRDYLETHDLDSAQSPLKYDLHKYASYLEKHHLDAKKCEAGDTGTVSHKIKI